MKIASARALLKGVLPSMEQSAIWSSAIAGDPMQQRLKYPVARRGIAIPFNFAAGGAIGLRDPEALLTSSDGNCNDTRLWSNSAHLGREKGWKNPEVSLSAA